MKALSLPQGPNYPKRLVCSLSSAISCVVRVDISDIKLDLFDAIGHEHVLYMKRTQKL